MFARSLSLLLCLAAVTGCSDADDSPEFRSGSSTAAPVQVQSFDVEGTSAPLLLTGPEPIDSNENGGRFQVTWLTSGSPEYTASLYVSKDGGFRNRAMDPGGDMLFFRVACGGSSQSCGASGSFECVFRSDNRLSCANGTPVDMTNWFDRLPQDAHIVLEATSGNYGAGRSVEVQFR